MLDFIDVGSSKGGSVEYCMAKFGKNGYGIDIDERKVKIAQEAGLDVRHMSIFDVQDRAKWCTALHCLEHIDGYDNVKAIVDRMAHIGRNIYVTFPYFDMDGQLFQWGLRPYWSYWKGHRNCMSTLTFHNILTDLGLDYKVEYYGEVKYAHDPCIVPITAPVDSLQYNESMGKKPFILFANMYRETRWTITV